MCIDGRHLCDASNLNLSFRVFSQVQEARGWVQQVTDHLIVDLKKHRNIKSSAECTVNKDLSEASILKLCFFESRHATEGCLFPLKRLHSGFHASYTDPNLVQKHKMTSNIKCYIFSNLSCRNHCLLGGRLSSAGVSVLHSHKSKCR